jgi:hypothetical protein
MDDALAEARGYRVSLVLAHQHLAQLPPDVGHALDANARNKVFFTVPLKTRGTSPEPGSLNDRLQVARARSRCDPARWQRTG